MTDSRSWTRPRFLLALLLAALVAGAVPIRTPASRGDKSSPGAAWRAAWARSASPGPDADLPSTAFMPAAAPEPLPDPRVARGDEAPALRIPAAAPTSARSPLPRAPPAS